MRIPSGRPIPVTTLRALCLSLALLTLAGVQVPAHADAGPDFAEVVRRHDAAVVNIAVSGVNPQASGAARLVHGEGSGFIVRADGLIVTNAHVVRDARHIVVKLKDRREFEARVIGVDDRTDVAVLAIDASALPTVTLGRAADVQVGQWVLAIGSPFGFEHSVSAGVVSARQRTLAGPQTVPLIQTDVAVNPGNSGGPLFNAQGEVVGINTAIYSGTGGYQGLSFAIPIDVAMRVTDQILAQGRATHARVGLSTQTMNLALARSFGLAQPQGVLVLNVDPEGPAHQAGLQVGDVVLAANGRAIRDADDVPGIVATQQPGEQMHLSVWREGRLIAADVTLADASPPRPAAAALPARSPSASAAAADALTLGLVLREGRHSGALVASATGSALEAGVNRGDVILAVNGDAVANPSQARRALAAAGPYVALLIERRGERAYVPITRN
ncbi:MAG: hypothetical protein RI907_3020 [Pseudomonadota bacterium]|jgi:serine protease Do